MNAPDGKTVSRAAFVASLLVLGVLYGWGSRAFGWFPDSVILEAGEQARALWGPPHWVSPKVYDREGARLVDPEQRLEGLTLIAGMWRDSGSEPGLKLIDREGRTVHEWPIRPGRLFPNPPQERTRYRPSETNIHGAHVLPNGDALFNVQYVGTVRIDACGRPKWRLAAGNHHAVTPAHDGSYWIPGGTWKTVGEGPVRIEGLPLASDSLYHDRLIRVSAEGEILQEIDVLELLYSAELEHHLVKGSRPFSVRTQSGDLTHLNDIEPLDPDLADEYPLFEAGDLAVSLRNLDLVFVVDPETGEIKWHASDLFVQQHDPDFLGDGWIGVFDNHRDGTDRGTMLGGSRVVAVQPHTDSRKVLYPKARSEPFYTEYQGKWQQLENGNLLLTEAQAGRVAEMAPNGRTVWEWITEPYGDRWIPEITEGRRYSWSREAVAAWPCVASE